MLLLIIAIILISAGLVFWFVNANPFIGYLAGAVLGMSLTVLVFRKLGRSAQNSLATLDLFTKLTAYNPSYTINIEHIKPVIKNEDYKEMMIVLKEQMGFKSALAKEAINFAISRIPNETIDEKLREALKYLGDGHKDTIKG